MSGSKITNKAWGVSQAARDLAETASAYSYLGVFASKKEKKFYANAIKQVRIARRKLDVALKSFDKSIA